ncbi:MAG: hypothetical protein ACREOK_07515 [Gemmatimonadaceae bacterium]
MDTSAIDFGALATGVVVAVLITAALAWATQANSWPRVWIVATVLTVVFIAIGLADLLRERPRETHIATVLVGIPLPVLGGAGMQYAMRRVRPWLRWTGVFLATLVLLLSGMLIGAAMVPRWIGA